jgi:hypothetical protein
LPGRITPAITHESPVFVVLSSGCWKHWNDEF